MKLFKTILILLSFSLLFSCCTKPARPPVADAGPDQMTQAGSYAIFDGRASRPGDGDEIIWWKWEQNPSNPDRICLFTGEDADSIWAIGFDVPGIYRFTLTVSDGVSESEPDEFIITVNPQDNDEFDDPYLETHIRWALKKQTGILTENDYLSLDSLHVVHIIVDEVWSLKGIDRCANLVCLHFGMQLIDDISPLASLTKLIELDLNQNYEIADVTSLSNLVNLEYLCLFENSITDISPLQNLTKLIYLDMAWNPIEDISVVENLINLEKLYFSRSKLSDVSPVKNLNKLKLLWLSRTEIEDISPLLNLNSVTYLNLGYNRIGDITPLSSMSSVEKLYLHDNNIVNLTPLENLDNLYYLSLGYNSIEDVLPLVNNQSIGLNDFIDLSSNPLSDISINQYIQQLQDRGVIVLW